MNLNLIVHNYNYSLFTIIFFTHIDMKQFQVNDLQILFSYCLLKYFKSTVQQNTSEEVWISGYLKTVKIYKKFWGPKAFDMKERGFINHSPWQDKIYAFLYHWHCFFNYYWTGKFSLPCYLKSTNNVRTILIAHTHTRTLKLIFRRICTADRQRLWDFRDELVQQSVGIPMDTNCAPLVLLCSRTDYWFKSFYNEIINTCCGL